MLPAVIDAAVRHAERAYLGAFGEPTGRAEDAVTSCICDMLVEAARHRGRARCYTGAARASRGMPQRSVQSAARGVARLRRSTDDRRQYIRPGSDRPISGPSEPGRDGQFLALARRSAGLHRREGTWSLRAAHPGRHRTRIRLHLCRSMAHCGHGSASLISRRQVDERSGRSRSLDKQTSRRSHAVKSPAILTP